MSRILRTVSVVGVVLACFSCCGILSCLLQPKVRDDESWARSAYSLRVIGEALKDYHDVFGKLPPSAVHGKDGKPLYSWRVLLLPFLEEDRLYRQFRLDEPWDSPHNKQLAENCPRCYQPHMGGDDPPGMTRYQVFVGPGTAFERAGLTWNDFPDGRANTILVVEAGEPVPWSKPADLAFAPGRPLPALGGMSSKPVYLLCHEIGRERGFNACFGDGTTRFIPDGTDNRILRALITRNGNENVDVSRFE